MSNHPFGTCERCYINPCLKMSNLCAACSTIGETKEAEGLRKAKEAQNALDGDLFVQTQKHIMRATESFQILDNVALRIVEGLAVMDPAVRITINNHFKLHVPHYKKVLADIENAIAQMEQFERKAQNEN